MGAKAKGKDILKFYEEGWPDGYFHDYYEIDPEDGLEPDEKYDLEDFGGLYLHNPPGGDYNSGSMTFEAAYKKWLKTQTHTKYVVHIPKGMEKEFEAALKTLKGKIEK